MALQSFLAKNGSRSGTLGTAANLAWAFPLAEANYDPAAGTDATRIGWYADRTGAAEKIGVVVMGTERAAISVTGVAVTGKISATGQIVSTVNGAASTPAGAFTGSWFTGGSTTTTKPQMLIEANGATSTPWSVAGTGLGVNSAAGFVGNLLDLKVNGTSVFTVSYTGAIVGATVPFNNITSGTNTTATMIVGQGATFTIGEAASTAPSLNINGPAATRRQVTYMTSGLTRWDVRAGNGAESGSNAGSSYIVGAYDDTGVAIDNPIVILRAAGGTLATTRPFVDSYASIANVAAGTWTGAWFTGGSTTTTKPQLLIEPTGTTSIPWSTAGTGLGVNATAGFTGNLLDLKVNGVSVFTVPASGAVVASLAWNSLTTPSGNLSIAMAAFTTAFTWNTATTGTQWGMSSSSLSSGTLEALTVTGTAAAGNTQTVQAVSTSGANATTTQTTFGSTFSNTHTGTASTNVAAQFAASGGSNNYGIIVSAGRVGFSTTTPVASFENAAAGAASTPGTLISGAWFTGGSTTTTKPQMLVEPTGTTSTPWSVNGTGLGVNAAAGFTGNLLDLKVNGVSVFTVPASGNIVASVSFTSITSGTNNVAAMIVGTGASFAIGESTTSNPTLTINGAVATQRSLVYQTAGSTRWNVRAGNAAESGANVGSSYIIQAFDDTGVVIDAPVVILRAAGGTLTTTRPFIDSYTSIASVPAGTWTGSWFTGGSATTTKPQLLIEPTGTTTNNWSTLGTGIGVNATAGFTGNLLDLQINGVRIFAVGPGGVTTGVPWSSITAPTTNLSLAMAANTTAFTWNTATTGTQWAMSSSSLSSGTLMSLAVTGTAATANTQVALNISVSGAIAAATQTTYGAQISNTHTSAGSDNNNVGLQITASGAGNANYALLATGDVGLGTATPVASFENANAGASAKPGQLISGAWFTGGGSTNTKPQLLIQPTGTTSNAWPTTGTGLGINAASGFTGNLFDAQLNAVSKFKFSTTTFTASPDSAASTPVITTTGVWFSGGSSTTTKPHVLIEVSGATSNNWSTSGTGLGINAANAFAGALISAQVNGQQKLLIDANGDPTFTHTSATMNATFKSNTGGATGGALLVATCDISTALTAGVRMGGLVFAGSTTGSVNTNAASIEGFSEANWSATSAPSFISFKIAPSGSVTRVEVARISSAGYLGLNTAATPVAGFENKINGAASFPGELIDGTWFTGGTATTTKPQLLIEPSGTASTAWSTAGTGLGINATSGATGDLINAQTAAVVHFSVSAAGKASINTTNQFFALTSNSGSAFTTPFASDNPTALCLTNDNATLNNWTGISFGGTNGTGAPAVQAGIYSQISNRTVGSRANNLVFYTATAGASTERMQIGNTGLVGIGTVGAALAGLEVKTAGAASQPGEMISGTWFTGGSSTTTKPQSLIQPTGTTSNNWSTSGTGIGVNAAAAFAGNLIDLQINAVRIFAVSSTGVITGSVAFSSLTSGTNSTAAMVVGQGATFAVGENTSTTATMNINGAAATQRALLYQTAGLARWNVRAGNGAESGGNAGSSYIIQSFDDTGVAIDVPLIILRPAGGTMTTVRPWIDSYTSIASVPAGTWTGTWFTGGSTTTTKPHFLIEPTGATSTGWSTAGTGLGVNAASGFTGNLLDVQLNGVSKLKVDSTGKLTVVGGIDPLYLELASGATNNCYLNMTDGVTTPISAANQGRIRYNNTSHTFQASVNGGAYADIGGGGGSSAFSAITAGTNTTAAMVLGTGSSLATTGTGFITSPRAGTAANCEFFGASAGSAAAGTTTQCVGVGTSAGAGLVTAQGSTFVGYLAGSVGDSSNTVGIGQNVLSASGAVASNSVGIGSGALTHGANNSTAVGAGSLGRTNMTGTSNSMGGYNSGPNVSSGTFNSGWGAQTSENLTTGIRNSGLGALSLQQLISGNYNVGLGYNTLTGLLTGSACIGLGTNAGANISSAATNTLIIGDTSVHATDYAINTVTVNSSATGGPTWTNANIYSAAGVASASAAKYSGAWFTGGSTTTTKPQLLVEASGAASTGWNTNGTGFGVNAASGFTGLLADFQVNGVSQFSISSTGAIVGTLPWNSLAAPSGNLSLAMAARTTNFAFDGATNTNAWVMSSNSLTSGVLVTINCTSGAALSSTQQALRVTQSGANTNSNQKTFASVFQNTKTGTGSTNVALHLTASGGDSNYGLIVAAGLVGIQSPSDIPLASFHNAAAGQLSLPGNLFDGTWITGGNANTCKPYTLISVAGSTESNWSTSGTGLGINAANAFAGNLLDLQVNGTRVFRVNASGDFSGAKITQNEAANLIHATTALTDHAAAQIATMTNGPTAGNPSKWIQIDDAGTPRFIPCWS